MMRVLFLCTHNTARSQIAEGLLRSMEGTRFQAFSAATEVTRVHPFAIAAMSELGVDISRQYSKSVSDFTYEAFDLVITVCDQAAEAYPVFSNAKQRQHWSFPDPSAVKGTEAERLATFREVRSQIKSRIEQF